MSKYTTVGGMCATGMTGAWCGRALVCKNKRENTSGV